MRSSNEVNINRYMGMKVEDGSVPLTSDMRKAVLSDLYVGRTIYLKTDKYMYRVFQMEVRDRLNIPLATNIYSYNEKKWIDRVVETEEEFGNYKSWLKYCVKNGLLYIKD